MADLQDKLAALTRGAVALRWGVGVRKSPAARSPPADYLVQRYTASVREREHHDALAEAQALQLAAEAEAARVSQHAMIEARVLRGAADQQARALQHLRSSAELVRAQDAQVSEAQRIAQGDALRAEVDACRAQLAKERER